MPQKAEHMPSFLPFHCSQYVCDCSAHRVLGAAALMSSIALRVARWSPSSPYIILSSRPRFFSAAFMASVSFAQNFQDAGVPHTGPFSSVSLPVFLSSTEMNISRSCVTPTAPYSPSDDGGAHTYRTTALIAWCFAAMSRYFSTRLKSWS